jgi:hypothetical protein
MTSRPESEWHERPTDPDLQADLGYDIDQWETVDVQNENGDYHVLLPTEEEMLKRDAFIIIPSDLLYSLVDHR